MRKRKTDESELSKSEQLACLILFLGWLAVMVGAAYTNL